MKYTEKINAAEEILRTLVYIKGLNSKMDIERVSRFSEYVLDKSEFQDRELLLAAILYKGFEFVDVDFFALTKVFGEKVIGIFADAKIYSERNRSIVLSKEAKMLLMAMAIDDCMVNENNVFFYKELLENSKGVCRKMEMELDGVIRRTIGNMDRQYYSVA